MPLTPEELNLLGAMPEPPPPAPPQPKEDQTQANEAMAANELRAAKEELERTKRELEGIKQARAAEQQLAGDPALDPRIQRAVEARYGSTLDHLQNFARNQQIQTELGQQLTPEQIAAIAGVQQQSAALNVKEALQIAQARNPSLFEQTNPRGFNPAVHYSPPPSGRAPVQPVMTRLEHLEAEIQKFPKPYLAPEGLRREYMKEMWLNQPVSKE